MSTKLKDSLFETVMQLMVGSQTAEDAFLEASVESDGVEYASGRMIESINKGIPSKEVALQLILEELDAMNGSSDFADIFIKESGFNTNEYIGSIRQTKWEGDPDTLEIAQLGFRSFIFRLKDNKLRSQLALSILDRIMKKWELGRYSIEIEKKDVGFFAKLFG